MAVPPIVFSGFNYGHFDPSLQYIYDTVTSGYRAVTQADLAASISITGSVAIDDFITLSGSSQVGVSGGYVYASGVLVTGIIRDPSALISGATGTATGLTFSPSGALYVQTPNLERTSDTVTSYPNGGSTPTGTPGQLTGLGTVMAAGFRNQGFFQNIGVNPIYLALSGTANPANYNMILKGGSSTGDGNGASWAFDNFYGSLSVSGSNIAYLVFQY